MFVCSECGHVFDEPKRWKEKHGLDCPPYENFSGCPSCGGAYADAPICDCCGDYISGDFVVIDDQTYCDNCFTLHNTSEL